MPLGGELTTDQLAEVTRWAGRDRHGRPDLNPLDWDVIAAETLDAYEAFRAHP
jgi:hypothetical protein